ncbi:MAG: magnesium-translocating P-type ATPase [Candidatus Kapabacteria bacterium]|nr:magnesium-translocating P-type ATPase [Candidatus Kapabacteria bacterium]
MIVESEVCADVDDGVRHGSQNGICAGISSPAVVWYRHNTYVIGMTDKPVRMDREVLLRHAAANAADVLYEMQTSAQGLAKADVEQRRAVFGPNDVERAERVSVLRHLVDDIRNPLVLLLIVLCVLAVLSNDLRAAIIIGVMLVIGVVLRTTQESRSDKAARHLRERIHVSTTVIRDGASQQVPVRDLVPGDIVSLAAGDMVPADVRLITSDDMHVDQSLLTGESFPIEKDATRSQEVVTSPLDHPTLCFQGATVQTGYCTAVVLATGDRTFVGAVATHLAKRRGPTAFDAGIDRLTWLMITIIVVLAPTVTILNGLMRGDWVEALLFGIAVAVGLTPEMLPMIVTVNLVNGAMALSRRQVIVKRLSAVQDLGAIDVLCTDKTGTLTQGKVILMRHVTPDGSDSEAVLHLGYLNSYFEAGLKNLMDNAVLDHEHLEEAIVQREGWQKFDENPFDFHRRRISVMLRNGAGATMLICKGAVEEVLRDCIDVPTQAMETARSLQESGFRVVAVATAVLPATADRCSVDDEHDLHLEGFLAFLDPPKESAAAAIDALRASHVRVMVLTGDSALATRYVCSKVGMQADDVVSGTDVAAMTDAELEHCVETASIFVRLEPLHKERIIAALQRCGHVVGFLGDGINDALALRRADVGISVDTAVDIAREASDLVLLDQQLLVLHEGLLAGRRVFGNVVKYIRMTTSSSVGNVLSYVGASILLPFVPMLPIQILLNNLLYDLSQLAIPTDTVDDAWTARPRQWNIDDMRSFMFIAGPVSSVFDYATFAVMVFAMNAISAPSLFHTGWFIESICTQTLVILAIRSTQLPWRRPRPSLALVASLCIIVAAAIAIPFSPVAQSLGFIPLPAAYWPWLGAIVAAYLVSVRVVLRVTKHHSTAQA